VVELYPRLCTGPVHKRNREDRVRYLDGSDLSMPEPFHHSSCTSEDAFDAAISALVMDRHADDLEALTQATDPVALLEGSIWVPRNIGP
jgi:hypothetical protein